MFNIERKSARNQSFVDAKREEHRLARRARRSVAVKPYGPRFHRDIIDIPNTPPGTEVVKFHGEPAVVPAKMEGEPEYGKSGITLRQLEVFQRLDQLKDRGVQEESYDPNLTVIAPEGYLEAYGL